jgi:hypothetical protein
MTPDAQSGGPSRLQPSPILCARLCAVLLPCPSTFLQPPVPTETCIGIWALLASVWVPHRGRPSPEVWSGPRRGCLRGIRPGAGAGRRRQCQPGRGTAVFFTSRPLGHVPAVPGNPHDFPKTRDLHRAGGGPSAPSDHPPRPWGLRSDVEGEEGGAPRFARSSCLGAFDRAQDPAPAARGSDRPRRADLSRGPRTRRGPARHSRRPAGPASRAGVARARRRATRARPWCGARGCGRSRRGR